MAVAVDAVAHGSTSSAGTSIPNFTLTIGGGVTNGAVIVAIGFHATTPTGVTVTVGGSSASLISSTTASNTNVMTMLFGLATGSSTGAKTVSVSWTNSTTAGAGAISFSGVDQTTPFSNGNTATYTTGGAPESDTIAITSTNGDLTFEWNTNDGGNTQPTSPTQTQRFSFTNDDFGSANAGSTGPGTGTTTHQWTFGTFEFVGFSGANVKAAAAAGGGGALSTLTMLGVQ